MINLHSSVKQRGYYFKHLQSVCKENHAGCWCGNLNGKDYLEELGLDGDEIYLKEREVRA